MITKEQLIEEIETVDDVQILEQVHQLIQQIKQQQMQKKRMPPAAIAGKANILTDLVEPIFLEQDFECLN